jgi:hypothetical protein
MRIPPESTFLFRELPILSDEQASDYRELVDELSDRLKPEDRWEWRSVRRLADKYWELHRLEQYPRHLIQEGRRTALKEILGDKAFWQNAPLWGEPGELVAAFFDGGKAKKRTYARLRKYGLNDTSISARAFEVKAGVLTDCYRVMTMLHLEISTLLEIYNAHQSLRLESSEGAVTIEGDRQGRVLALPPKATESA